MLSGRKPLHELLSVRSVITKKTQSQSQLPSIKEFHAMGKQKKSEDVFLKFVLDNGNFKEAHAARTMELQKSAFFKIKNKIRTSHKEKEALLKSVHLPTRKKLFDVNKQEEQDQDQDQEMSAELGEELENTNDTNMVFDSDDLTNSLTKCVMHD